ncbi:MAG: hypothetical protein K2F74_01750, partial [Muribaculaceae bacterium]|nr:hypothetical protein [Muribaculaceae bacterium]
MSLNNLEIQPLLLYHQDSTTAISMSKPKKIKPMAASQRITRNEFCATHFNAAQFNSDMFYVGLAN